MGIWKKKFNENIKYITFTDIICNKKHIGDGGKGA